MTRDRSKSWWSGHPPRWQPLRLLSDNEGEVQQQADIRIAARLPGRDEDTLSRQQHAQHFDAAHRLWTGRSAVGVRLADHRQRLLRLRHRDRRLQHLVACGPDCHLSDASRIFTKILLSKQMTIQLH